MPVCRDTINKFKYPKNVRNENYKAKKSKTAEKMP